jgi:azurin
MFARRYIAALLFATIITTPITAQPVSITIKALTGLKYDVTSFNIKPGADVTLTLNNVSDMAHNLIITKPGARESVVQAALQLEGKGPEMNFIPQMDAVLWSIPLISPGQSSTIKFKSPKEEGVYPYVCTYPGHGFVMFGEMHVTKDESMPEPKTTTDTASVKTSPHPYTLVPPYLYHVFIDGASPAAIAVHLPKNLSYCWDMTTCSLRYAWSGDFVDMSDLWKGHFDASAKILGEIFYRNNEAFPLRIGDVTKTPAVKYKGYKLINRYPEFHYTVNGTDVYEMTLPKEDGFGLNCEFRIPQTTGVVWMLFNSQNNSVKYEYSAGKHENGRLKLSADEAKKFTITITSYNVAFKRKDQ